MSRTGGPRTSAAQHWATFENSVVNLVTLDHCLLPASNRIRIKNRVATGEIPNDHSIWQIYRSWIQCTMLCRRGALLLGFNFDALAHCGRKGQNSLTLSKALLLHAVSFFQSSTAVFSIDCIRNASWIRYNKLRKLKRAKKET